MAVNQVIYQQSAVEQPKRGWTTGTFGCFEDMPSCCYGYWCCPCLACSTTGEFGESACLPLVDVLGVGLCAALGIPTCVPPVTLSVRVAMRYKYHLQGSLCEDLAISCFCVACSWCQMARELKHIKGSPTAIIVQPVAYSNQPQPQAANVVSTTTTFVNEHGQAYPAGPSFMPGQAYPPAPYAMSGQAYPQGPYPMPGKI